MGTLALVDDRPAETYCMARGRDCAPEEIPDGNPIYRTSGGLSGLGV